MELSARACVRISAGSLFVVGDPMPLVAMAEVGDKKRESEHGFAKCF